MIYDEQKEQLEKISGMSVDQAKELLLEKVESDVRRDAAMIIKRVEEETREHARIKSRDILITTLHKGRCRTKRLKLAFLQFLCHRMKLKAGLSGVKGRNIRAFEQITGINLIIDDTPEAVVLSRIRSHSPGDC